MNPYNVLIIESQFDDKTGNELNPNILFGPQIIFAESKRGVVKKAVILSKISAEKIEDADVYINEFSYISNYEEDN